MSFPSECVRPVKQELTHPYHCYLTVQALPLDNEFEKLLVFIKINSMSSVACRNGVNEPCMSKHTFFMQLHGRLAQNSQRPLMRKKGSFNYLSASCVVYLHSITGLAVI